LEHEITSPLTLTVASGCGKTLIAVDAEIFVTSLNEIFMVPEVPFPELKD
jgi:hypothetical protein